MNHQRENTITVSVVSLNRILIGFLFMRFTACISTDKTISLNVEGQVQVEGHNSQQQFHDLFSYVIDFDLRPYTHCNSPDLKHNHRCGPLKSDHNYKINSLYAFADLPSTD